MQWKRFEDNGKHPLEYVWRRQIRRVTVIEGQTEDYEKQFDKIIPSRNLGMYY
jgi:hypothetical protein